VTKALEDSDKCISLDPTFVKGYHRKASALHALGEKEKSDQAVALLMSVIDTGMDDKDLVRLGVSIHGKSFAQQLDERRKARALPEQPPATAAPAAVPSSGPKAAGAMAGDAKAAGEGKGGARGGDGEKMLLNEQSPPPWAAEPEEFAAGCLQPILKEFMMNGFASMPSVCFLQPSPPVVGSKEEPQLGQINIKPAFTSPTNLAQCADFLRNQVSSTKARSAAIFVRKGAIEYPCVWKEKSKKQWAFDDKCDGVFMQCESSTDRVIYFTVLQEGRKGKRVIGETVQLDISDFALLPKLFGKQ